jgi:hypothetical protein
MGDAGVVTELFGSLDASDYIESPLRPPAPLPPAARVGRAAAPLGQHDFGYIVENSGRVLVLSSENEK